MRPDELARGLYPHQVEGLAFLVSRRGAILADDMGLGKTRQAVLALHAAAPKEPHLVVCPASVKRNWAREIELALPGSAVHVVGEPPPPGWRGWVVVHYDALERHLEALLVLEAAGVVFDEAHYLKNHTTRRSRLSRRLLDARAERPLTYLLTGTPLTSRPRDLFPLLQLIRHPLGRAFMPYARRYCAAWHNGFGWVTDGASHTDELALELRGVLLRRTKDEVLDLPPKVRTFLEVDVPADTAVRETRALLELLLAPPAGGRSPTGARLLAQLTSARRRLALAKVTATLDLVDGAVEQGEKVLVFSCFEEPLRTLRTRLGERCLLLTGKTPVARRQALVDRFQEDPAYSVLATTLQTGGVGLNLSAARQVVFNDLDWVPANHWQAEDRAHRIGQTGSVHVTTMVAPGTLDSFVSALLVQKTRLVEQVVGGLDEAPTGDALATLAALVHELAPTVAAEGLEPSDPAFARRLLEGAGAATLARAPQAAGGAAPPTRADPELLDRLARALSGPTRLRYRITSPKDPSRRYVLESDGESVTCDCAGFAHRGTCSHARTLKEALLAGEAPPSAYLPLVPDA